MKGRQKAGGPIAALVLFASLPAHAATAHGTVTSRTAEVEGVTPHYLPAGRGPAVLLLHGDTQASRMWTPVIPLLAQSVPVAAAHLPGIGDPGVAAERLETKHA